MALFLMGSSFAIAVIILRVVVLTMCVSAQPLIMHKMLSGRGGLLVLRLTPLSEQD
jgi:hypothetical protein